MEKIQKYAYKTMLAMKNPLKSVDRVYPLAFDEISNHDGYYFGVKNSLYLTNAMEEKLKQCSYYLHTRDQSSLGGRAIDTDLKNPITGLPMTGSSSGTAINVFLGINDIGMGTDGGGSVLAPAISLNLFSVIDPLLFQEERKKENEYFFFLDITEYIPLLSSWPRLIFDGYYNKEWLVKNYKEEKNAIKIENEKTDKNLFKLLRNWGHLNKTDFEPLIKLVFKEFDEGMYLHPDEILHFASIMMLFSKWNLIPDTIDIISEKIAKFLTDFFDEIIPVTDWGYLTMEYGGYGYNTDFPEFKKILDTLREFNSKNVAKQTIINIREEVKILNTDEGIDIFCKDIIHMNGSGKYYKQPILSFLDMESFYNILKTLSIENQQRILYSFVERYGKSYSNEPLEKEYYPDYENVKLLCNIYKSDVKDIYYDPQEMLKSNLAEKWAELLSYFKRKINA